MDNNNFTPSTSRAASYDAGLRAQAQNRGDGIFLGATDNKPGDDVDDAHRAFSMAGLLDHAIFE